MTSTDHALAVPALTGTAHARPGSLIPGWGLTRAKHRTSVTKVDAR